MSVDAAAIFHAVAEPGIDQLDTVLLHEQNNVVVDRGNARGDGNIEGNRGAIVLRHVGRNGIAADLSLRFEQSKIESLGVPIQRPGHPQSRDTRTDNGNPSRHRRALLHSWTPTSTIVRGLFERHTPRPPQGPLPSGAAMGCAPNGTATTVAGTRRHSVGTTPSASGQARGEGQGSRSVPVAARGYRLRLRLAAAPLRPVACWRSRRARGALPGPTVPASAPSW